MDIAPLGFSVDTSALDQAKNVVEGTANATDKLADAVDNLADKSKDGAAAGKDHVDAIKKLGDAAKDAGKNFDEAAKSVDKGKDSHDQSSKAAEKHAEAIKKVGEAAKEATHSYQEYLNIVKSNPGADGGFDALRKAGFSAAEISSFATQLRSSGGLGVARSSGASAPSLSQFIDIGKQSNNNGDTFVRNLRAAGFTDQDILRLTQQYQGLRSASGEGGGFAHEIGTELRRRRTGISGLLGGAIEGGLPVAAGMLVSEGINQMIAKVEELGKKLVEAGNESERLKTAFNAMGEGSDALQKIDERAAGAGQSIEKTRAHVEALMTSLNRYNADSDTASKIVGTINALGTLGGATDATVEKAQNSVTKLLDEQKVGVAQLRDAFGTIPGAIEEIATKIGVSKATLEDMAATGKLSGKQLGDALASDFEHVTDKAKKIDPAGKQAATEFQNAMTTAIERIDNVIGASKLWAMLQHGAAVGIDKGSSWLADTAAPAIGGFMWNGAVAGGHAIANFVDGRGWNTDGYSQQALLAFNHPSVYQAQFASATPAAPPRATEPQGDRDLTQALEDAAPYAAAQQRRKEAKEKLVEFHHELDVAKKKFADLDKQAADSAVKQAALLVQLGTLARIISDPRSSMVDIAKANMNLSGTVAAYNAEHEKGMKAQAEADQMKTNIQTLKFGITGAEKAAKAPAKPKSPYEQLVEKVGNERKALELGGPGGGYEIYLQALQSVRKGGNLSNAIGLEVEQRSIKSENEIGLMNAQTDAQHRLATALMQGGDAYREMEISTENATWKLKTFGNTVSDSDPIVLKHAQALREAKAAADELAAAHANLEASATAAGTDALGQGGYASRLAEFNARAAGMTGMVAAAERNKFNENERRSAVSGQVQNDLDYRRSLELSGAISSADAASVYRLNRKYQIEDATRNVAPDQREATATALNNKLDGDREKALAQYNGEKQKQLNALQEEGQLLRYGGDELKVQQALVEKRRELEAQGITEADERYKIEMNITVAMANRQIAMEKENARIAAIKTAWLGLAHTLTDTLDAGLTALFTGSEKAGTAMLQTLANEASRVITKLLDDLAFNPLINALEQIAGNVFPGLFGQGTGMPSGGWQGIMRGGVVDNGSLLTFAGGGVFSHPRTFPMANGGTGQLGEAGPEAVMPLVRLGNGRLGVAAAGGGGDGGTTVHIYDQRGANAAPVEVQERQGGNGQRQLEVMIRDTNRKAIRNGEYDTDFRGQYGISRQIKRV